ncbi:MAG TPA: Gfo/Idh/MocA family oxidoreductase [Planctomycetota bacterium]|nr:Gfo/Idh/MocA family oxidoreductase [Planctomycetota bacterium]
MTRIGAAVVGAGMFGKIHARTYAESDKCDLLYVSDRDYSAACNLAELYGATPTTSVTDIAADDNVHAVSIATPDAEHYEPGIALITAGKHVICEKPLATRLDEARRLYHATRKKGSILMVDFHNRFNPPCLELKRRLQTLGRPIHGSICLNNRIDVPLAKLPWAAQTGPEWFLLPHVVDLARWYAGAEPQAVTAMRLDGLLKSRGLDVPDAVLALLEFDGCSITVESSWVLPQSWPAMIEFEGKIVCENGRGSFRAHDHGLSVHSAGGDRLPFVYGDYDAFGERTGFFRLPVLHFIDSIAHGVLPAIYGRDGLMVTMIVEAIMTSAAQKRRVLIGEFMQPSDAELGLIEEEEEIAP